MITNCPNCGSELVPFDGPTKSGILLVGEFPGWEELSQHQPWVGKAGDVLKQELTRAGIQFEQCRRGNLWNHQMPDSKAEKVAEFDWHFAQLLKEFKAAKFLFLMGSELAPLFFKKSVSTINGLAMESTYFPKNIQVAVASFNPAICLQPDGVVGDFRFAVKTFAEFVKKARG